MIFVTGTKRSGTSMWMQIMIQAGFPYIGEPYPRNWMQSIQNANKEGFYESSLRQGIYHKTNPNSKTGAYLFPQQTKRHVIKVFVPGLVRSDIAFIDRVVGTIRPWREYVASIRRLYDMEDQHLATLDKPEDKLLTPLEHAQLLRGNLHPALEWWMENYDLIRNFITRRFPINLVSYQKLLDNPTEVIPPVLEWCGGGDIETALSAVNRNLNTQRNIQSIDDAPISNEYLEVFDELHAHFYEQKPMKSTFLEKLNGVDDVLRPLIVEQKKVGVQRLKQRLLEEGASSKILLEMEKTQQSVQNEMGF